MNNYTVILYETDEPVVETNWTSYPAALAFANKIFARRSIQVVKIWNGFAPEDPENKIIQDDDLLYMLQKGNGILSMDHSEGKMLYPAN